MTTSSRTLRSAVAAPALLAPALAVAAPATAAPRSPVVYDALGDSYGSGYGVPPYLDGCGRSGRGVRGADRRADADRPRRLRRLRRRNDRHPARDAAHRARRRYRPGDRVHRRLRPGRGPRCAGALAQTTGVIQNVLPSLLDATYAQIAAAAPDAHVVVTGYPRLFSPEYGDYVNASPTEQQAINDGADLLNSVIAEAAGDAGFQFVDVTSRFSGHGVNASSRGSSA